MLVCGAAATSFGQLVGVEDYFLVLKGATSFTSNAIYDCTKDPIVVDSYAEKIIEDTELNGALLKKPKAYYYLILQARYTPTPKTGAPATWSGQGVLDNIWPVGLICYGYGRHTTDGVWDAKTKFAFGNEGEGYYGDFGFLDGVYWLAANKRVGMAGLNVKAVVDLLAGAYLTYEDYTPGDAYALLTYKGAKKSIKTPEPMTWYQPSACVIEMWSPIVEKMSRFDSADELVEAMVSQFGTAKVKFSLDSKLTATANANVDDPADPDDGGINHDLADAIDAALTKGKYPTTGVTDFLRDAEPVR